MKTVISRLVATILSLYAQALYLSAGFGDSNWHTSFTESLKQTAKDSLDCASDLVHYTLNNPADAARIPYDVLKAVITSPKALSIAILGVAVAGSGCTDKIPGADSNKSVSDYFSDIVIDKEKNLTVGDIVVVADDLSDGVKYYSGCYNDSDFGYTQVQYTTPDGMVYYDSPNGTGGYRINYDLTGDGSVNARDGGVLKSNFKTDFEFRLHLKCNYGIPYDSDFYEKYPDLKELRFRAFDLNGDFKYKGSGDQMQLIIDDEVVLTVKNDLDGDGSISQKDTFIQLLIDCER